MHTGPFHYTTLHHTTIHYTTLYYNTLHYIILQCTALHASLLSHFTSLYCAALHSIISFSTSLHSTPLYFTLLKHTVLHIFTPLGASLNTLLCCSAVIMAKRGRTSTRGQLPPMPWLLSSVALREHSAGEEMRRR